MIYDNTPKLTKSYLMNKYNLSESEYLRQTKRISAQLRTSKKLYQWTKSEVPNVKQLLDYKLKQRLTANKRFDIILMTTERVSTRSKLTALSNYAQGTGVNAGFNTFTEGIPQFQIMYKNAEDRLTGENYQMRYLDHFVVGQSFSTTKGYYFKNNERGRQMVDILNKIIDRYNEVIDYTTKQDAWEYYLSTVREIMNIINFADQNNAMSGSL